MRNFLIALLPFVAAAQLPTIPFSPKAADTFDTRVDWLKQHSSTLDDLQPFQQAIGKARVVVIYSPPGVPAGAELRIARFLHEEMGFDIFATHASVLQAEDFDRALDAGKHPRGPMPSGKVERPGSSPHIIPKDVVAYLEATHRTPHPLHTVGLRTFTSPDTYFQFTAHLFALIDRVDPSIASAADRKIIANLYPSKSLPTFVLARRGQVREIDRVREQAFASSDALLMVGAGLDRIAGSTSSESREALVYARILKDMYKLVDSRNLPVDRIGLPTYITGELLSKSKIIVWDGDAALEAGSRSGRPVRPDFGQLAQNSAYFLAIAGIRRPPKQRLDSKEEFDAVLYGTGKPWLFLPLRNLDPTHWLRLRLENRWSDPEFNDSPAEIFDGLIAIVR